MIRTREPDLERIFEKRRVNANKEWLKENLKEVRIVYTDLDNTLLGPQGSLFLAGDKSYTLEPAKAIVEAGRKNLEVAITSGRSRRQLSSDARILGLKNYLAELGCQLVYGLGKKVILNVGDFTLTEETVFETIAKSGAVEFLFKTFKGHLEYHTPWSEERECTHVFRGFIDLNYANKLLQKNGFTNLKMVDNGVIKSCGSLKNLSEVHAYHLLPKSADKASGVKKDKELRKILKKNCLALGDALSDLVLAPEVQALFIVKNALKEDSSLPKEIPNYKNVFITEKELGLGFAEVIKFLLQR